jgi:hypothetical protein
MTHEIELTTEEREMMRKALRKFRFNLASRQMKFGLTDTEEAEQEMALDVHRRLSRVNVEEMSAAKRARLFESWIAHSPSPSE